MFVLLLELVWNRGITVKALKIIYGTLSKVGKGKNNITRIDAGTCPKTIAETEITLSLKFFTMPFHMACKIAAKITNIKTLGSMVLY